MLATLIGKVMQEEKTRAVSNGITKLFRSMRDTMEYDSGTSFSSLLASFLKTGLVFLKLLFEERSRSRIVSASRVCPSLLAVNFLCWFGLWT